MANAVYALYKWFFYNDSFTLGVIDNILKLRGCQPEHKGNSDLSSFGTGSIDIHPFNTVVRQNGNPVTRTYAHIKQSIGKTA